MPIFLTGNKAVHNFQIYGNSYRSVVVSTLHKEDSDCDTKHRGRHNMCPEKVDWAIMSLIPET